MELTNAQELAIALEIMTDREVEEYIEVTKQFEEGNIPAGWEDII